MTNTNPPRWAEVALQLILKRRDRESIAGDLLEEYREVILPSRRALRRNLWYLGQIVSLLSASQQAVLFGALFGGWVLILMTAVPILPVFVSHHHILYRALSDNRLGYGGILALFVAAGFFVHQQTREIQAAFKAGAITALVSVGGLMVIVRVVFGQRLGPYVLNEVAIVVALGACCGAIGGFIAKAGTAVRTAVRPLG